MRYSFRGRNGRVVGVMNRGRRLGVALVTIAVGVMLPVQASHAQSLTAPSGAGVGDVSVDEGPCSSSCRGIWTFGGSFTGTFMLGGALQAGSFQVVDIYTRTVSQTSNSVTFELYPSGSWFTGSTLQGQPVSGSCGGTVTLTGDTSPLPSYAGITAELTCTAALANGPSEPISIAVTGSEVGLGLEQGPAAYTSS